jgi:hypothetical protein
MAADPTALTAARVLLDQLGITPQDLYDTPPDSTRPVPTLAQYLPTVLAATTPSARASYSSYWNRALTAFGDRRLDDITATDIQALMLQVAATARRRRTSRDGHAAAEHLLLALRRVYRCARADRHIDIDHDPARRVARPRRLPSTRRALTAHQLTQITTAAATGGQDAPLDALLLRLHTETACRRGGALHLRLGDLDLDLCVLLFREKGGTQRWQPVSPPWPQRCCATPRTAGHTNPTTHCCAPAPTALSPTPATTRCGPVSTPPCHGQPPRTSAPTGYATPP